MYYYFFTYSQPGPKVSLLIYLNSIHRAICRPSDQSVDRPRVKIRTRDGRDTNHQTTTLLLVRGGARGAPPEPEEHPRSQRSTPGAEIFQHLSQKYKTSWLKSVMRIRRSTWCPIHNFLLHYVLLHLYFRSGFQKLMFQSRSQNRS